MCSRCTVSGHRRGGDIRFRPPSPSDRDGFSRPDPDPVGLLKSMWGGRGNCCDVEVDARCRCPGVQLSGGPRRNPNERR